MRDWKKIIELAADTWTDIAKEWAIVRTPHLMDHNSEEYKVIVDIDNKRYEEREYREYLRLKQKYEGKA